MSLEPDNYIWVPLAWLVDSHVGCSITWRHT